VPTAWRFEGPDVPRPTMVQLPPAEPGGIVASKATVCVPPPSIPKATGNKSFTCVSLGWV